MKTSRHKRIRHLTVALVVVGLGLLAPAWSSAAAATCAGRHATIVGTPGNDVIVGKHGNDVIYGGGGNDRISGGPNGNDIICGGPGNDTIEGGRGYDALYGQGGDDRIDGSTGSDRIDGGSGNDDLDGSHGADVVIGGSGDDRVIGDKGGDHLIGGAGNDYLDGKQGSDVVEGGEGDDSLVGDKGNDKLLGDGGNDRLDGGPGDDPELEGGPGTDTIFGGAGSDNADGGPGDGDIVRGDAGVDTLSGGPGVRDILSYASATRAGVTVNLATGFADGDGHDKISGFEDVVGSPQDDTLSGDSEVNRLDGGVGDDTLDGSGSGDEAFGGEGADKCSTFAVEHSCGPEENPPGQGTFVVLDQGLDGASLVIQGSAAANDIHVSYGAGAWTVTDDATVFAGEGCTAAGASASCPSATPTGLVAITGGAGDDKIAIDPSVPAGVEVRASGNAGSDTVEGGAGADVLEAGENYVHPDSGNDTLIGNGGSDVLYADPGADRLFGGDGNDLLVAALPVCQGNLYDGGRGNDTVSYARSAVGIIATLGGSGGPAGCATPDQVLADNESLEGSDSADVLTGDNGDNAFLGHLGADTFIGKGGKDFIDAADGQRDKKIDCGAGDDELVRDRNDPPATSC